MKATGIVVALTAAAAWGAAGDIIRSFELPGQPAYGVRGLANDWSDGNVWVAGPNANDNCIFAKFNPTSASLVSSWTRLSGSVWVFDIGYGYVIGADRYLVVVDKTSPRMKVFSTAGSLVATLEDPFTGGFDQGAACAWDGLGVFANNESFPEVKRWTGAAWSVWGKTPATRGRGLAVGWGRLFAIKGKPDAAVYEFNLATASLVRTIPLLNWGSRDMVGLAIGRVNARGAEESLFTGVFTPQPRMIYEISVGDVTDVAAAPASLGCVKALYR
jgi:hypothetical protein